MRYKEKILILLSIIMIGGLSLALVSNLGWLDKKDNYEFISETVFVQTPPKIYVKEVVVEREVVKNVKEIENWSRQETLDRANLLVKDVHFKMGGG